MKGICFTEPLFYATVEGRKDQTRRIMKPQPNNCTKDHPERQMRIEDCFGEFCCPICGNGICIGDGKSVWRPRYNVGEVLYLKEPYYSCDILENARADHFYKFRGEGLPFSSAKWQNKLFMPAEAARYFVRITAVRAERLQDISDEDCIREGIIAHETVVMGQFFYHWEKDADQGKIRPRDAYAALIDEINGHGTWDSNPWVWVYDYELIEKPTQDGSTRT